MAREWLTGGGGGVNHVQTSEPTYAEGETWLNPDTGVYYAAYDSGNGGDWHPIPSISVTEESTTLDGSDGESISKTDGIAVNTGTATLIDGTYTTSRPSDNTWNNDTDAHGIKIKVNADLSYIDVTISSNTSDTYADEVHLTDTNSNILETVTGDFSSGDVVTINYNFNAGTSYYVVADNQNDYSMDYGKYDSANTPYTSDAVDITAGVYQIFNNKGESGGAVWSISDVTTSLEYTSGELTVSWGSPTEINSWDLATFHRTLDGATCQIDVLDSSDNILLSDIGENFDISTIDASKNVKLRATFSRPDTTYNPQLDYCARRYTR